MKNSIIINLKNKYSIDKDISTELEQQQNPSAHGSLFCGIEVFGHFINSKSSTGLPFIIFIRLLGDELLMSFKILGNWTSY